MRLLVVSSCSEISESFRGAGTSVAATVAGSLDYAAGTAALRHRER